MGIHGGDIYRNRVTIDFSTNVNPLGTPDGVKEALHRAVTVCGIYPDIEADRLREAVSTSLAIPKEYLLFGNGASELFLAVVHGIKPKKIVIPVPSFYGYEYAARAAGSEIVYYETRWEDDYCLTKDIIHSLTKDVDLVFLANPNNPTGHLLDRKVMERILLHCKDHEIYVVVDESFIEFCEDPFSVLSDIKMFEQLILVRTYTKIFAIPGVRIGYLLCGDKTIRSKIAEQLPEWNLSCFAQEAGCVCAKQAEYIEKTKAYIARERQFLERRIGEKGFRTFPSMANYMMIYSEKPLYERLLEKGILIRDCSNFRGLGKGFYRIAVRRRKENEILLREMESL